ncbi:MAG: DNA recombination protein RmuC [Flavobacterium sp.]|jgi:DNA recombination protein RmuC
MFTLNFLLIVVAFALLIGFVFGIFFIKFRLTSDIKIANAKNSFLENEISSLKANLEKLILKLEQEAEKSKQEISYLHQLKESVSIQLSKKESDFDHLLEKYELEKEELEVLQTKLSKDFEILASRILDEKTEKFTLQNKNQLQHILSPLQEKILQFEQKVENTHKESINFHATLREQIANLKDANLLISQETINLTKALKGDSKMQGNWGELILERVLEKSGLEKDREYFLQQAHENEFGQRVFPDVVIHLPNETKMIIDSKVSLSAFERYVNEEDVSQKTHYLKEHLISIKKHIDQLSTKNYSDLYKIKSPNFVLLFMPIEPAFAVALNQDTQLYIKAFEKNIIIVTPTTLLATLKTIQSMWNNQKQQTNALEIARQAGALYDKFEGFVANLDKIGKKIEEANTEYESARNKLVAGKGNLISSTERLKKLGAKTQKKLPENLITLAKENEE